jgi:hypothetical protein
MRPRDDDTSVEQSAEWQAAFEAQATTEMLKRLKEYAASRLAGVGRGVRVDLDEAKELAQAAIFATARGQVTWNPAVRDLEPHLQNVIDRRVWLSWKHAKKFPHESLDASADDARSTTHEDMERALAESEPDPEAQANAKEVLDELKAHARSDPELWAYLDKSGEGLTGRELEAATGLSPQAIRRVRRRLDKIRRQLPYQIRPTRRKRGT